MWSRRPRDAVRALRRLQAVRGFWEWPYALALPESPTKDRAQTAQAVAERAMWLDGGAFLIDEAYASYMAAALVLEQEWRVDPLEAAPLALWVKIAWRLATFVETRVGDEALAASYLAPVAAALAEQYVVPAKMPSAVDQELLLRWNKLNRMNAKLLGDADNEVAKPLIQQASQLLLRRSRWLLNGGAAEPGERLNDELVRDLTAVAKICDGKKDPLGSMAKELLVGLHGRREEYPSAKAHAISLLSAQGNGKGKQVTEPKEAAHVMRTATLTLLTKNDEDAVKLFERIFAEPNVHLTGPKTALSYLRHGAACLKFGRARKRDALASLNQAIEIGEQHKAPYTEPLPPGSGNPNERFTSGPSTAARMAIRNCANRMEAGRRAGGGGAPPGGNFYGTAEGAQMAEGSTTSSEVGLDVYQLWVARYTLGLTLQQDGVAQQALTSGFQPLLAPEYDRLPIGCRIASLTGAASCLSQLSRRVEALEACEAAVALGAGGEVLFAKALLLAQLGKIDDAIASLKQLLQSAPGHMRALSALSTLLMHGGQLKSAIGMAQAAKESALGDALPLQQVGLLRLRQGLENGWAEDVHIALPDLQKACEKHGSVRPPQIACDAFVGLALCTGFGGGSNDTLH